MTTPAQKPENAPDAAEPAGTPSKASIDSMHHRLYARLMAFREIGAPLLAAVSDWRFVGDVDVQERTPEREAQLLEDLVESTVNVTKAIAATFPNADRPDLDWARWALACASSEVVTAHYRATTEPLTPEASDRFLEAIKTAASIAGSEHFSPKHPRGLDAPEDALVALQIRTVGSLSPVVGAIARFPFGRDQRELLAEIVQRLQNRSVVTARHLAPETCSNRDWHALYAAVLQAAAELYADCHFAEMDRILDMTQEERAAYLRANQGQLPLTPVWDAFELRMSMLTAVTDNLAVPASSIVDPPERPR